MKHNLYCSYKRKLGDTFTPVSAYLRLRDKFPGSFLLECTEFHIQENSFSFICLNPIAGIKIEDDKVTTFVNGNHEAKPLSGIGVPVIEQVEEFIKQFSADVPLPVSGASSLFGYTSYDAVNYFDNYNLNHYPLKNKSIPAVNYNLFQIVIVFNHYNDELFICENKLTGQESLIDSVEQLLMNKNITEFPFSAIGDEFYDTTAEDYKNMVGSGIAHCKRGDVFQIVLSRRFRQKFSGDEFNVYRTLRSINPSPYLFYFDYGNFKLFGSSPEAQLKIENGTAYINPIAGTFQRTGNDEKDKILAQKLLEDEKENSEHVMLVDLARNDLSRAGFDVQVKSFREVHYYSHVIHLVSTVSGVLSKPDKPYHVFCATFPAGTLSGAPKHKAIQLINKYENSSRGFYGGAIGLIGLNNNLNHAIMIRSFISIDNELIYQAGAGIVVNSVPESELNEVNHKLNALREAIKRAETIK